MKSKHWLFGWFVVTFILVGWLGYQVYRIDPFFHYRKPDVDKYFYTLDNQRSQNDGITKWFDYDAMITGTSMTENFKTSEADRLFGSSAIKVPYRGATYKEINDSIHVALNYNPNLKFIIRGLDMSINYYLPVSEMRTDLGVYPEYLYDDNPINDYKYILNGEVIRKRILKMMTETGKSDFMPGITSFDDYSNWQETEDWTFGKNSIFSGAVSNYPIDYSLHLSEAEKNVIKENIEQNITALAENHPNVDFYVFFTPYSIAFWLNNIYGNNMMRQLEAEQYIIELILEADNIKLFSFNNRFDIITDLNNYKDPEHYGEWINSLMLKWMYEGKGLLTKENYQEYLKQEADFYMTFDYESLNSQEDYENDYYAAALLNQELTNASPEIIDIGLLTPELSAETDGINQYESVSANVFIEEGHKYLMFDGYKTNEQEETGIVIFDKNGDVLSTFSENDMLVDGKWHQYCMDVSDICGEVKIVITGDFMNEPGDEEPTLGFRKICIY